MQVDRRVFPSFLRVKVLIVHTFNSKLWRYGNASIAVIVRDRALTLGDTNFPGGGQRWTRNPRKLGMGVQHILGLLERGCQKLRVPIFFSSKPKHSWLLSSRRRR